MNVDLKVLVRLLLAILIASLISTIFLGKHIHRQIMESMERRRQIMDSMERRTIKPKIIQFETTIPTENQDSRFKILPEFLSGIPTKIPTETTKHPAPLVTIDKETFEVFKIQQSDTFRLPNWEGARKHWCNNRAMTLDRHRKGLGENGNAVVLRDPTLLTAERTLHGLHGFNAELSDRISVNRSLPDARPNQCHKLKYQAQLPNVTVVIAFHNEHFNTLLRSIHSLVNRSPAQLLREIVLVDDASNLPDLGIRLKEYLAKNFENIVDLVRLSKRRGLIKARMKGAKRATCKVLVFLDSHIEATHNWLPPLLGPIAIHRTIATGPILDGISHTTFGYEAVAKLTRSGFNWRLHVKHLPPFPEDFDGETSPYRTPLLVGAMAIDRSYFWELGGYDEELDIWGGEHLEMSFKIWMCGGMLLYIPCSRVAHISRGPVLEKSNPRNYNFLARNYKRVAEVWMDDYKKIVYEQNHELFHNVDAGNLTAVKAQRNQLKCKSFHWYMTKVAPDFLAKFPTVEPPPLSSGVIQSVAYPTFCVDSLQREHNQPVGLAPCDPSDPPGKYQDWALTRNHEIRLKTGSACLESSGKEGNDTVVTLYHCHDLGGNQFWYYNQVTKWIQQGQGWYHCLEAVLPNGQDPGSVISTICNKKNRKQMWNFGIP